MNEQKRRHPRLRHRAKIKVVSANLSDETLLDMRDFSESGLYLFVKGSPDLEVGTDVEVQTTEFEGAPVQHARVVRVEPGVGFAVEFRFDKSKDDSNGDIES